ncbi:MAG: hypothetical protein NZ927_06830 [Candidatus Calescibacterium sp.]|nr:hypothetical protein [Candidatus Calescibacterium sp.]MCX7734539.1 hypothetical protein [bacterium]MDW8087637.1 methyltransferase dimerization domain-containing protein [Candidatus Calescibacterium sp.]
MKLLEELLDNVYQILENQVEKKNTVGNLIREVFPVIYLLAKNPRRFRENIRSYLSSKNLYDFNSELIKLSALGTAAELGIFELISDGWKSLNEIANHTGAEPRRLETLLDSLVHFGFLDKKLEGQNTLYKTKNPPRDIKFLWAQIKGLSTLPKIIKEGKPSENLDIYNLEGDYLPMLYGVNSFLYTATRELMRKYKFENIKRIMVGSMGISFAKNIQKKFPDVEIHIGCYPHLIRHVPSLKLKYKIPDSSIISMKDHKGVPSEDRWGDEEKGYDLVFLTKKLSLRSLEEFGHSFLSKAFNVLRSGGYAVIWESIVDDSGTNGPINESILDLLTSYSGKRWKESEIASYVKSIGFKDVKIVKCLAGETTFAVAVK